MDIIITEGSPIMLKRHVSVMSMVIPGAVKAVFDTPILTELGGLTMGYCTHITKGRGSTPRRLRS